LQSPLWNAYNAGMTHEMGRALILVGILLVLIGVVFVFADRIPYLGRLPGDIVLRRKGFTLYAPIATALLLSVLLTLLLNLLRRR
jgi:Protein of unknown function (DUF2905)